MEDKWWTLIAVCVAIFMLLLDITVVNVALPDIQRSLHSSFQDLQWVVNAYALTLAAFLLTAGSLADRLGRKLVFTVGLVVFTGASVVCGLSSTSLMLNLARGVQGVGGAMMFATSLALIAQAFVGRERGVAFGVFGAATGAAVAVGPLVGGVITSAIGWEWIFFVNLPIGIAAVAITLQYVRESRDPDARGIDWAGLVTFSGSLFLLVFALVRGNDAGWGSPQIVGGLIAAAVLMALFIVVELGQERPMLELSLFRRPAFTGASIVAFTLASSIFAMFLYLTLYLQDVLGYGPLQAGLRFLPVTLLSFAVAPVAGRLSVRVPIRMLLGTGLALVAARPVRDDRGRSRLGLDGARARLRAGRCGDRDGQPAARLGGGGGRSAGAERDGLGHQLDVPAGGDRDRHRRPRSGLPAQRHAILAGGACGVGPRRAGCGGGTRTARGAAAVGRDRAGRQDASAGRAGGALECLPHRLHPRPLADPRDRRRDRAGRLRVRLRAGSQPRLRRDRRGHARNRGGNRPSVRELSAARAASPRPAPRGARSRRTRARAAAGSAGRQGPRASACTGRSSSRACCARSAGVRSSRRAPLAAAPHETAAGFPCLQVRSAASDARAARRRRALPHERRQTRLQ